MLYWTKDESGVWTSSLAPSEKKQKPSLTERVVNAIRERLNR